MKRKELVWIASSRRDLKRLPEALQKTFGFALGVAQLGKTPPIAKVLKGFGNAGVLELIEDDSAGTYRAVYTVRFSTAVFVLHVFQKKSKRGIETPKHDMDLIAERLKQAEQLHLIFLKERGK